MDHKKEGGDGKSWILHGVLGVSRSFRGKDPSSMETSVVHFRRVFPSPRNSAESPRHAMEFHGAPRWSVEYHGVPRLAVENSMESRETSMGFRGVPWASMEVP